MDWISHIIFGLAVTRLAFLNRPQPWEKHRNIIILMATAASVFPDLDILTTHRSELHAPLVLFILAGITGLVYPLSFRPVLAGLLSHSLLDIFLFDNSQGTIRHLIDQVVTNDTTAGEVNEVLVTRIAAQGIMLLYPISRKMYYVLLTENTYALAVAGVLSTAIAVIFLARTRKT